MARWHMEAIGELVTLTYFTEGKPPQKCGQTERGGLDALEAWVADQMEVGDACTRTTGETYFRQNTPSGGVKA